MGGQHAKPAGLVAAGSAASGPESLRAHEELSVEQFEVSLVRHSSEVWGIAWNVDVDDAHRLVVAGVSPASAAGRWNAAQLELGLPGVGRGDELLAVNRVDRPGRGQEEVRLVFRRASAPRQCDAPCRISEGASSAAPSKRCPAPKEAAICPPTSSSSSRQLLEPRPIRIKNTFIYVSDSDEPSDKSTEGSPEERTTQSDPFPVSQFSRQNLPKSKEPVGGLAGADLLPLIARMAAAARREGTDSPWTSDGGWLSARSCPSAAEAASPQAEDALSSPALPSCPSTDWEFIGVHGGLLLDPSLAAVLLGDHVEDDIFVTSEDEVDESRVSIALAKDKAFADAAAGGAFQNVNALGLGGNEFGDIGMKGICYEAGKGKVDMLKELPLFHEAPVPSRCLELLQPPAFGALQKDNSEWDTDESTTVANSSLADRRRTRRAGKRARHRPCHMRGKEGPPGQSAAQSQSDAAGARGAPQVHCAIGHAAADTAGTGVAAAQAGASARHSAAGGPAPPAQGAAARPVAASLSAAEPAGPPVPEPPPAEGAGATAEPPDPLVGKRALLKGLVRSPEFNGQWGRIESFDGASQRYLVRVTRSSAAPVLTKIRRENLIIPPPLELKFGDADEGPPPAVAAETATAAGPPERPRPARAPQPPTASATGWRPSLRM